MVLRNGHLTGTQGWRVKIDWITSLLIVIADVIFLFGTTFASTQVDAPSTKAVTILVVGIASSLLFGTVTFDLSISRREFAQIFTWTIACVGASLILNFVTPKLPMATFDPKMFGVLLSVAETMFFQAFFLIWLSRLSHKISILGAFLCAGGACAFHFFVYGLNLSVLAIVFGCFLVLNLATLQTQRLTPAMLGHSFINFLAG